MTCVRCGAAVPRRAFDAGTQYRAGRVLRQGAGRRIGCWIVLLVALQLAARPAAGDEAGPNSAGPTSSWPVRQEAVQAIPWRQIAPQHRRAAQQVVKDASIYRRLPTRVIDCDPEMFTFLARHPEVVIDVWRVMGLSRVSLERLPDGAYRGADGAGTIGTVRFLCCDWGPSAHNLAVVYADGAYEGKPFIAPIKAQSVLLLRSGAIQETNGRHYVTVQVDSFVRIEQVGIELVAKTIQPWIARTADYNFIETLTFVSNFSRTAERNPSGIERLATQLPSVDDRTRRELVALSHRTAERYARETGAGSEPTLVAQRTMAATPDEEWIGPLPATTRSR